MFSGLVRFRLDVINSHARMIARSSAYDPFVGSYEIPPTSKTRGSYSWIRSPVERYLGLSSFGI